jgi:hypothetical protein
VPETPLTNHFTHGIPYATIIRIRFPVGDAGPAVEIEDRDGVKTLLALSRPEDYALPERAE